MNPKTSSRNYSGRKTLLLLVAGVAIGTLLFSPVGAHVTSNMKHLRKHMKKTFYTKKKSNKRFVNVGETASNSNMLDGMDSADFAAATHTHAGEDITSGFVSEAVIDAAVARDGEVLGIVMAGDGSGSGLDADTVDGIDSTNFLQASRVDVGTCSMPSMTNPPRVTCAFNVTFLSAPIVLVTGTGNQGMSDWWVRTTTTTDFTLETSSSFNGQARTVNWIAILP